MVIGVAVLDEELGITRDKILASVKRDGEVVMI